MHTADRVAALKYSFQNRLLSLLYNFEFLQEGLDGGGGGLVFTIH